MFEKVKEWSKERIDEAKEFCKEHEKEINTAKTICWVAGSVIVSGLVYKKLTDKPESNNKVIDAEPSPETEVEQKRDYVGEVDELIYTDLATEIENNVLANAENPMTLERTYDVSDDLSKNVKVTIETRARNEE